jgi:multicomponent Na+:H+ antiporter subunit G
MEIFGAIISLIGSLFLLLASVGIIRMPDTYNRMQTGTKATTLGSILFFVGIAAAHTYLWGKIIALIMFVIFTNPLSSNALARALHFIGAKAVLTRDELEDYSRSSQKGDQS